MAILLGGARLRTGRWREPVDLNGSFVYTPNSGFFGTDTFTYAAEDTTLSVSSQPATVTITVNEVNQAPTISAPATAIVNEGGKLVFSAAQGDAISAADADFERPARAVDAHRHERDAHAAVDLRVVCHPGLERPGVDDRPGEARGASTAP